MAWINVISEEDATGDLSDLYRELVEPWGGVDNILIADGLGVSLEDFWEDS